MTLDRRIHLEGSYNVRDLGGVRTRDGRMVCRGQLFRADAMHALTDRDLETLAPLGIRTVIDLRSTGEIEEHGSSRLAEVGAQLVHAPILGFGPIPEDTFGIQPTLGEDYQELVRIFPQHVAHAINEISRPEYMPLVFHCASGKDRTGIASALILSVLGVDRAAIITDYVITDAAMNQIHARLTPEEMEEVRKRFPPNYLRAEAESITWLLDRLDDEHGSAEAWLRQSGVKAESFGRLREAMLD